MTVETHDQMIAEDSLARDRRSGNPKSADGERSPEQEVLRTQEMPATRAVPEVRNPVLEESVRTIAPIKEANPPEAQVDPHVEQATTETPKVGSRDAPGG